MANLRTPPKPISRAVIVTRVSTEKQADNTSHENQLLRCREFCASRGWQVVLELEEEASGALYLSRTRTQAALLKLERGEAEALVFYDCSRSGRDQEFVWKMLKRIVHAGCQLQLCTFPLDYEPDTGDLTPESEQMLNMLLGTSSVERRYIRRRTAAGRQRKLDKGIQVYRSLSPWGWHIVTDDDKTRGDYPASKIGFYMPVPEQLRHIPEIFRLYGQGEMSLSKIAQWLQSKGVPTARGGRHWAPATIKCILENPVHMGRPAYGKTKNHTDDERQARGLKKSFKTFSDPSQWSFMDTPEVRAHFEEPEINKWLVPEALWWQCQERLKTNQTDQSGRPDRRYPLAGMVRCLCGRALVGRSVNRQTVRYHKDGRRTPRKPTAMHRLYLCSSQCSRFHAGPDICTSPKYNAAFVEELVYGAIARVEAAPELLNAALAERLAAQAAVNGEEVANRLRALERELSGLDAREIAAAEAKVTAMVSNQSVAPYDAVLARIAATRASLLQERQAIEAQVNPEQPDFSLLNLSALVEVLQDPEATHFTRNELLMPVVSKIFVHPGEGNRKRCRPSRVDVHLRISPGTYIISNAVVDGQHVVTTAYQDASASNSGLFNC